MRRTTLVLSFLLAACNGAGQPTTTVSIDGGAETPVRAIELLRDLLAAGDFDTAGRLGVPEQAVLASLAEGASPSLIAEALDEGGEEISANFWSGFAQGAGEVLSGEITVEDSGSVTERGVEFFLVGVTPEGGMERLMVTRNVNGQRVDLFGSFGVALAEGMLSPVELLVESSSPDAGAVLAALQDVVPSLLVSATDPNLSPDAVQRILQLVELITRVG